MLKSLFKDIVVVTTSSIIGFILIFSTHSCMMSQSRADDAVLLEKEKPAPYTGVLMPVEKVQELRKSAIELENEKVRAESLQRSVELYKDSEKLQKDSTMQLQEQNAKLAKTVAKGQGLQEFELLFAAGGGILLTGNIPVGLGVMGGGLVVWIVRLIAGTAQP